MDAECVRIDLGDGLFATVDQECYRKVSEVLFHCGLSWKGRICDVNWRAKPHGRTSYAVCTLASSLELRLHRAVLGPSLAIVDHINGDGLDNRKANLRIVSSRQNCQNRAASSEIGHKGVYKGRGKNRPYQAHIRHEGVKIHLGSFATAHEAAMAYNRAAITLFGEFARLNEVGV